MGKSIQYPLRGSFLIALYRSTLASPFVWPEAFFTRGQTNYTLYVKQIAEHDKNVSINLHYNLIKMSPLWIAPSCESLIVQRTRRMPPHPSNNFFPFFPSLSSIPLKIKKKKELSTMIRRCVEFLKFLKFSTRRIKNNFSLHDDFFERKH